MPNQTLTAASNNAVMGRGTSIGNGSVVQIHGNNTTDQLAEVQRAVDALPVGGRLELVGDGFLFSGRLNLKSYMTLSSGGVVVKTTITSPSADGTVGVIGLASCTNVTVDGVTVEAGPSINNGKQVGIAVNSCSNILISNCIVRYGRSAAIYVGLSSDITIEKCTVQNVQFISTSNVGSDGILCLGVQRARILNNVVSDFRRIGITVDGNGSTRSTDPLIEGNTVSNAHDMDTSPTEQNAGIWIENCDGRPVIRNNTVSDISNNTGQTNAAKYACGIVVSEGVSGTFTRATFIVEGNNITVGDSTSAYGSSALAGIRGIWMQSSSQLHTSKIRDNTIKYCREGIFVGLGHESVIENNNIECGTAAGVTTTVVGIRVHGLPEMTAAINRNRIKTAHCAVYAKFEGTYTIAENVCDTIDIPNVSTGVLTLEPAAATSAIYAYIGRHQFATISQSYVGDDWVHLRTVSTPLMLSISSFTGSLAMNNLVTVQAASKIVIDRSVIEWGTASNVQPLRATRIICTNTIFNRRSTYSGAEFINPPNTALTTWDFVNCDFDDATLSVLQGGGTVDRYISFSSCRWVGTTCRVYVESGALSKVQLTFSDCEFNGYSTGGGGAIHAGGTSNNLRLFVDGCIFRNSSNLTPIVIAAGTVPVNVVLTSNCKTSTNISNMTGASVYADLNTTTITY